MTGVRQRPWDSNDRRDIVENREARRDRIEMRLQEWGVDLEKLKLKVDKEIAEAQKAYYEHLEELRDDIELGSYSPSRD